MKSYIDFAVNSLKYRWKRTLFMLIGVVLMVMLLCSAVIIIDTNKKENFESIKRMAGDYHLRIDNLNDEYLDMIFDHQSTQKIGRIKTVGFSYANENLKLNIVNYDDNAIEMLYLTPKEGHMPQNDTEIAIEDWILSNLGIKSVLGQDITMNIINQVTSNQITSNQITDNQITSNQDINQNTESIDLSEGGRSGSEKESYTKTYKLSGILYNNRDNYIGNTAPVFIHIDSNDAIGSLSAIIQLKDKTNVSEYENFLNSTLQIQQSDIQKNHLLLQRSGMEESDYPQIDMLMLLVIVISAALLFVISNMFSLSIRERVKDIGILKALGGTFYKIMFSLISEAFAIGIIAIPIGAALGILQSWAILQISNFSNFNMSFQIPWLKISMVLILSFISLIVSVFITAFTAGRLPTLSAINGVLVKKPQKNASKLINNFKRMKPAIKLALVNMSTSKNKFIVNCCALGLLLSIYYYVCYTSFADQQFRNFDFKGDFSICLRDSTLNHTEIETLSKVDGVDYVFCPVRYANGFVALPPEQVSESYLDLEKENDIKDKTNYYSDLHSSDEMRKALTNPFTNNIDIQTEIYGVDDKELALLAHYLKLGEININKMKNEKFVIILQDIHRIDKDIQLSDFKLTDSIMFSYRDKRKPEQSVLDWINAVNTTELKYAGYSVFSHITQEKAL